jgi:hypothetical protein
MSRDRWRLHWILKDKVPVPEPDLMTWARWMEDSVDERVVKRDADEESGWLVSTVFLGLDHNFSSVGPPILFESMVFKKRKDDGKLTGEESICERYSTWAEAEAGHNRICSMLATELELTRDIKPVSLKPKVKA